MRRMPLMYAGLAGLLLTGVAACDNSTAPAAPVPDTTLTADLAAATGDALAMDVADLVGNESESSAGLSASAAATEQGSNVSRIRTRTCYDANDAVVTCGQGLTSSMVVTMELNGSVVGEHFNAVIHRARHDSISGLNDGAAQRTHNGFGSGSDTTTFTTDVHTRTAAVAATDTVKNLVFNLPHANNPWPVSGQIIRNVNALFTFTGAKDVTRTVTKRFVVTFPADAEGNVSLQANDLTCTLNLVTHKVTNCTSGG